MDRSTISIHVVFGFLLVCTLWYYWRNPKIVYRTKVVADRLDKLTIEKQFNSWLGLYQSYKKLEVEHRNTCDALKEYAEENRELMARLRRCEQVDTEGLPATSFGYRPPFDSHKN